MELSEFERSWLSPASGFRKELVREFDLRQPTPSNPFWAKSEIQSVFPCSEGVVWDKLHGYRVLARCGKWTCDYCGDLRKGAIKSEIQALRERHQGLSVFSVLTFRTLKSGLVKAKGKGYLSDASVKAVVRRFVGEAGKILGTRACFKGWEPHKSGAPHLNILWFGVRRDFTTCNILNKRDGKYDMRLQCRHCDACKLREIWRSITGAPRSTHVIVKGKAGGYVTKYITKFGNEFNGFWERFRRYSFSRACKRSPDIVPVYRYIGNWLRHSGLWKHGLQKPGLEKNVDYLTDYYLFTQNETEYKKVAEQVWQGYRHARKICAAPQTHTHTQHTICLPVPYWSPSRIHAWGGVDKVWEWFGRAYGEDTKELCIMNIKNAVEYYKGAIL